MRKRTARALRRIASTLIRQSNKLDPPEPLNHRWPAYASLPPGQQRLIQAMVDSGLYESKGAARRGLGFTNVDLLEVDGEPWLERIASGIAGGRQR